MDDNWLSELLEQLEPLSSSATSNQPGTVTQICDVIRINYNRYINVAQSVASVSAQAAR